jgi:signal transduction histidine kinase
MTTSLALPEAAPTPATSVSVVRERVGWWVVLLGTWLLLAGLSAVQVLASMSALGGDLRHAVLSPRLFDVVLALPAFVAIDQLERRAPPERIGWAPWTAIVLALLAATAAAGALWNGAAVHAITGQRVVIVGSRVAKGIAEWIALGASVGAATAYALLGRLRAREAQALQLEARLAEARLQALASQLQPHFLFNTLNAVATLVHRDPEAADATLTRLADLLRATLRQPATHEIPLREELGLLDRYVEIMRVRYGARLTIRVDADESAGDVLVPPFVLQPLVENALEHGVARRAGPGSVVVTARVDAGRLRLEVVDDGPGPSLGDGGESGIGLPNTRRRLATLYGDAQRLVLEAVPGGGARALVELPARREARSTERR